MLYLKTKQTKNYHMSEDTGSVTTGPTDQEDDSSTFNFGVPQFQATLKQTQDAQQHTVKGQRKVSFENTDHECFH